MGVNGNNSKMDKTRKIQLKQSAVWQYFVVRLCANTIKIMLLLIDVSAYYLYLYVQMCNTNMHQRMVFIMFDLNSTNKCLNIIINSIDALVLNTAVNVRAVWAKNDSPKLTTGISSNRILI